MGFNLGKLSEIKWFNDGPRIVIGTMDYGLEIGNSQDRFITKNFYTCNPVILRSADHSKFGILHHFPGFAETRLGRTSNFDVFANGDMQYLRSYDIHPPTSLERRLSSELKIKIWEPIQFPYAKALRDEEFYSFEFIPSENNKVILSNWNRPTNKTELVEKFAFVS